VKIFFLILLLFIQLNSYAEEIPSLAMYINKHPSYLTNSSDVEYLANRCGALMNVLSERTREAGASKEMINLANRYNHLSDTFSLAGLWLSKVPKASQAKYIEMHKIFLNHYSGLILKNWKKGNIFQGLIEQDFTTCAAHEAFYLKLSAGLK
jgi:hypothetical protein